MVSKKYIINRKFFQKKSPLPILRIDDRLIHGQVVVGWGNKLGLHGLVLANDTTAKDEMMKELYLSLMPPEIEGYVCTIQDTEKLVKSLKGTTMIVVENPSDALKLVQNGLKVEQIVIGGLHDHPGCRRIISYVFLDQKLCEEIQQLLNTGIPLACQDLPTNPAFKISEKLLEE
jgi:PTS system mannose-specific IIB component